jgi:2-iminobutanoate/2-iminopropanoate deaminase
VDATPRTAAGAPWTRDLQYSQTVRTGDLVFTAGQGGFDADGELVSGGFEPQLRQTLANLSDVLRVQGADLDTVVKLTVYLVDVADYDTFRSLRSTFLSPPYPASTAVAVKELLVEGMRVEIDAVAVAGLRRQALHDD